MLMRMAMGPENDEYGLKQVHATESGVGFTHLKCNLARERLLMRHLFSIFDRSVPQINVELARCLRSGKELKL